MRPLSPLKPIYRWSTRLLRVCLFGRAPPLFDAAFYSETYPEIERTGIDPYLHYAAFGARRGYDPAEDFATAFHVRQSGRTWRTPVAHYAAVGVVQGLDPSPRFSTLAYLGRNADIRERRANPLLHYRRHGQAEGRVAEPSAFARRSHPILSAPPTVEVVLKAPPFSLTFDRGPAAGEGWRMEPRIAIRLHLTSEEFERLRRLLPNLGATAAVSLRVGGTTDRRPRSATAMLVLDACLCRRAGHSLEARYAEVRLWDLRTSDQSVACLGTIGRIVCAMPRERRNGIANRVAPGEGGGDPP